MTLDRLKAWARHLKRRAAGQYEPEIALLPRLVPPHLLAVDVGANTGSYCWFLRRLARQVVALEPLPDLARHLQAAHPEIRVIAAAASSHCGTATIRRPLGRGLAGLATIETANALPGQACESLSVPLVTLDSLALPPVGFIKIDVEGHELEVVAGAAALLARDRPSLLIESEDRHRADAVSDLLAMLQRLRYSAHYLRAGTLHPAETRDPANPPVNYIFLPE